MEHLGILGGMTQTTPAHDAQRFVTALGVVLRGHREARGLTRAQIEQHTGMGRSTVQRIENGVRPADVVQLSQIVNAINAMQRPGFPRVTVAGVLAEAETQAAGVEVTVTDATASVELGTSAAEGDPRTPPAAGGSGQP